ncbi:MAG TPA: GrpB family protein [Actinomycetota bacterium]
MTTDEELWAVTIGEPRVHDGPIGLADSDPAWPAMFEREVARISAALGERALLIEHVGSTSVPGLAAKPIIDMVMVVRDSSDEASYVPALERGGYTLRIREPDWFEHRLLKGPDTDVNLHVFSEGCPEVGRMLRFRDHLRTDPADRKRYEEAKRELAARNWKYVQNYADAKTEVIEEILTRAYGATRA